MPGLVDEEVELTCQVEESSTKSNDVKEIISIVINKEGSGQFVASVSDYGPASITTDQENVEVSGDVSGTSGEKR